MIKFCNPKFLNFSKMDLNGTMIQIGSTSTSDIQIGSSFVNTSIVTFEVIGFILLGLGVSGMHQGIEISHPVYSVLFFNMCFNFALTLFNLVLTIFLPLNEWVRGTIFTNFLGMLFHNTRY